MMDVITVVFHLFTAVAKLVGPGGSRHLITSYRHHSEMGILLSYVVQLNDFCQQSLKDNSVRRSDNFDILPLPGSQGSNRPFLLGVTVGQNRANTVLALQI